MMTPDRVALQETRKANIFNAMKALHINLVTVDYSGGGDSGQVDDVSTLFDSAYNQNQIDVNAYSVLEEMIKEFVYKSLNYQCGGWETNEGSQGQMTFANDQIVWDHAENYIEVMDHHFEL